MSVRIVIDNEDADSVPDRPWTANFYDSAEPDEDGQVVAFGASPLEALTNLVTEYRLVVQ